MKNRDTYSIRESSRPGTQKSRGVEDNRHLVSLRSVWLLLAIGLSLAALMPSLVLAQTSACTQEMPGDFVVGRTTGEVVTITDRRVFPARVIVKNRSTVNIRSDVEINGDILLCDSSLLKVEHSIVTINMRYWKERQLSAYSGSTLEFYDSFLINDRALTTAINLQNSNLIMNIVNRVDLRRPDLLPKIGGFTTSVVDSSVSIIDTYYLGELSGLIGRSSLRFIRSWAIMLWINFVQPNSGGTISPPYTGETPINWRLDNRTPGLSGIDFSIELQDARYVQCGVMIWTYDGPQNANITIKDTSVAVGLIFADFLHVGLRNFKEGRFENFTPTLPNRRLTLENTAVWSWAFYAWGSNLEITNSEVGELLANPHGSRTSNVTVWRSKLAGNGGSYRVINSYLDPPSTIEINDCDVYSDLTATSGGVIKLKSSRIYENGRVGTASGAVIIVDGGTVSMVNSLITPGVESTVVGNGIVSKVSITPFVAIRDDGRRVVTLRGDASLTSPTRAFSRYTIEYAQCETCTPRVPIHQSTTAVDNGILFTWNVPDDLAAGNYVAIIKMYDSSGSVYEASRLIRIPTTTGAIPYSIRDNGAEGLKTSGVGDDFQVASIAVSQGAEAASAGAAIFSYTKGNTTVTETAVPDSPLTTRARAFVVSDNTADTTIAISNPGGQEADVSLTLISDTGSVLGETSLTVPPSGQIAKLVKELIATTPPMFQGSLHIESDQPVASVALKRVANQSDIIAVLPVVDEAAVSDAQFLTLPHITDGNGARTQIVLMNTTNGTLSGRVHFYSPTGDDLPFTIGGQSSSQFPYNIGPDGILTLITDGIRDSYQLGYALVMPASSDQGVPYASALFSSVQSGSTLWEAGYVAPPSAYLARTLVELSERIKPEISIVNPNDSAATVTLSLKASDGLLEIARATRTVPPRSQLYKPLDEMLGIVLGTFWGTLNITSTSPLYIVGLRSGVTEEEELMYTTTVPVIDRDTLPRERRLVFPYVIDGSGFRTQVMLVNADSSTITGLIYFLTPNGDLQPIEFTSLF